MLAQLIITLTDAREVTVEGPIGDKLLSLGLLEVAKSVIVAHQPSAVQVPRLVPANGGLRRPGP